jgi:hypothetical protein
MNLFPGTVPRRWLVKPTKVKHLILRPSLNLECGASASISKRRGVVSNDGGEGAINEPARPRDVGVRGALRAARAPAGRSERRICYPIWGTSIIFSFASVQWRCVMAGFDDGIITSDAGALLLGATSRAIGLIERFATCRRDPRPMQRLPIAPRPAWQSLFPRPGQQGLAACARSLDDGGLSGASLDRPARQALLELRAVPAADGSLRLMEP